MTSDDAARGTALANMLDWYGLVAVNPAVVQTKTGRLQVSYAARGRDTEQMGSEERSWYLARQHSVLRLLDHGWVLDADWWHEPTTDYPITDWDRLDVPRTDVLVDAIRHADFLAHPRHDSALFLTLSWAPPAPTRQLLLDLLVTRGTERRVRRLLNDDIARLQEGTERFLSLLAPHMASLEPLDPDGVCTYLHSQVSWDRHRVRCPSYPYDLDHQLTSELWVPGQPPTLGTMRVQTITIKTWHLDLRTWLPEALSKMPFPCRYMVRWAPMSPQAAERFLKSEEQRWAGSYRGVRKLFRMSTQQDDEAEVSGRDEQAGPIAAGQSIVDFQRAVARGEKVAGTLTMMVVVWAETQPELESRVKLIWEAMHEQGLVARIEGPNASIQWLASLAGHVKYGIRGWGLDTQHLEALLPRSHMWTGVREDPHLKAPAALVAATDGAPFYLSLHVGDLGGIFLQGPSRTGKSAKIGLLVRQTARYARRRWCLFDRDFSLKAVTLLSGGAHYTLGEPGSPRLQLFGNVDSELEQQWAVRRLEDLLTAEDLAPTPEERRECWKAIKRLASVPRRERRLRLLRQFLQVPRLKVGLDPFCEGGPYAFCDGTSDEFAWESRLLCFEMGTLLRLPRALNAVMAYNFQQLETQWFTGDPVYIGMDEAKWLTGVPIIRDEADVYIKARAKLNVSLLLAVQEIYDLYATPLWQAIIANMQTKILLPNPEVFSPAVRRYYDELGVPEPALAQLAMAQPYRDYLYLSPHGWRLYQCRLSEVERLLCAASQPQELEVLEKLQALYAPAELPAAWLRHWGYGEYAEYVTPQRDKELTDYREPLFALS